MSPIPPFTPGGGGGLPDANFTPTWNSGTDVMEIASDVAFFYGIGAVRVVTDITTWLLAGGQYSFNPSVPLLLTYPNASAYGQEVTQIDFLDGPNTAGVLGSWSGLELVTQEFDVQYNGGTDELTITRIVGTLDLLTVQSINYSGSGLGSGQLQQNTNYVANSATEIVVSQASFYLNGPGDLEQLDFWNGVSFVSTWNGSVAIP